MKNLLWFALIVIFCLPGCGYFKDRVKDASEMFEFGMGISMGLDANLRATKLAQVGVGSYAGHWIGLREGRFAYWVEDRVDMGLSPLYFHEVYRRSDTLLDIRHPLPSEDGYDSYMNDLFLLTDRGFFEIGFTFNLIFLGVDAAFEGAEIFDFITGFFGFDPLADDAFAPSLDELVNQVQSRSAWRRAAAVRALRLRTGQDFGYKMVTSRDEHPRDQIEAWKCWNAWLKE
ncbi:MAG: hypothetical protein KJ645_04865 [Planctomycetes bacterium]|nr:hypothetical protein [Planctomycetota bacterium]